MKLCKLPEHQRYGRLDASVRVFLNTISAGFHVPNCERPSNRETRNLDNLDRCDLRIHHPRWNQEGWLITDAQRQMLATVVKLICNYDRRPSKQRVEWAGDLNLAPQIPGIMRPRRTAVDSAPRRFIA